MKMSNFAFKLSFQTIPSMICRLDFNTEKNIQTDNFDTITRTTTSHHTCKRDLVSEIRAQRQTNFNVCFLFFLKTTNTMCKLNQCQNNDLSVEDI